VEIKKIEYGAHYPFVLDDPEPNTIFGPTERSEAEGMVKYVNQKLAAAGKPQIAMLIERTVTVSEWEPANSGVVPPFLTDGGNGQ
jgi:hypothetical protein